ncbi:McrA Restriction endonuclease [uncultured Caudovirales phage]|uniref:McrA Restriction endonuclease n=1 Tax=uncultured Caudovirales phage TaxID=2100421 RepID=A0A6J5STK8_9CAUD|nr:McrA Restriction endonuclease [uncultured Caudovirales phage]
MAIAVPCLVCGRRVVGGKSRCPAHEGQRNTIATSCVTCGKPCLSGWCADHDPELESNRLKAQPFRAGYRDPAYHREKQAAKTRAGGKCERCGRSDLPLECDHVVALKDGGKNERSNLVFLCRACHGRKSSRDRQARKP